MYVFATSNVHYEIPEFNIRGRDFPSISITGRSCDLMCKHCYGRLLHNMLAISEPDELMELARNLRRSGIRGLLVSGGCDRVGRVPFEGFIRAIKYLKELGFRVFIHSGIVDEYRANLLRDAGVDAVLIDFVLHEGAIKEVIGLNDVESYVRSVEILMKLGVNVVPHVIIGLYRGLPSDEFKAIDLLNSMRPKAVVFVVFTPYPNTPLEDVEPPPAEYVINVMRYGREMLRNSLLVLGCMRPRTSDYSKVEVEAIRLGFNGIAFPSIDALNYMVSNGIVFSVVNECCASIIYYHI